jgi:hypothetical protein
VKAALTLAGAAHRIPRPPLPRCIGDARERPPAGEGQATCWDAVAVAVAVGAEAARPRDTSATIERIWNAALPAASAASCQATRMPWKVCMPLPLHECTTGHAGLPNICQAGRERSQSPSRHPQPTCGHRGSEPLPAQRATVAPEHAWVPYMQRRLHTCASMLTGLHEARKEALLQSGPRQLRALREMFAVPQKAACEAARHSHADRAIAPWLRGCCSAWHACMGHRRRR